MSALFWRSDSCTVTVGHTADGALEFHGHDLRAFGTAGHEYEYVIEVPPTQSAALRLALGIEEDADVTTALIGRVDDIMAVGEATWLTRHGVAHRLSVWDHGPQDQ